ncbi:FAD-binding oxidoreductase [Tessaracoccus caeni]|uniref:FAD-binding oxidoreductase n=1 Tax=Tessaracoccus caeni TaxID=3031239 RepID=UPI0023DA2678|nr:FAD-binding oxidoreductase [Tessaracoccus caeni]MDF1487533.1 FAD-binding oxidoreductase [Tessaracoccus caeni]
MTRDASALTRLAMAHDASRFLLTPEEVVTPESAEDVAELFRFARRERRHLTFRSGGTSLSGQGLTDGILADTRTHFRQIEVLDGGERVRVGPGATLADVNARLRHFGRRLGPDPASAVAATIGGIIANNSTGKLCGIRDNAYHTIESMVVVLPSGLVLDTADSASDIALRLVEPELVGGLFLLRRRLRSNPESVAELRRLFSMRNTMGYSLQAFLDHHDPVEMLRHLMVGSEGTLGFVAEATFRTVPLRPYRVVHVALFATLEEALEAVTPLKATGLDIIELLDVDGVRIARTLPDAPTLFADLDLEDQSALVLELRHETEEGVAALDEAVRSVLDRVEPTAMQQLDPEKIYPTWRTHHGLFSAMANQRPDGTSILLEDISVPHERISAVCHALTALFVKHGYENSAITGHLAEGTLHYMLYQDFQDQQEVRRFTRFMRDMVSLVLDNGGVLKAEHGTGRAMAPFLQRQYGDELYEVMREVKRLFDPDHVLNPNVILNRDPQAHVTRLKLLPRLNPAIDSCVECGFCEPSAPRTGGALTLRQHIVVQREIAARTDDPELVAQVAYDYRNALWAAYPHDALAPPACPLGIDGTSLVQSDRPDVVGVDPAAETKNGERNGSTIANALTGLIRKVIAVFSGRRTFEDESS